ncbi:MAG: thioredoxin-like domain-containing protein [Rhodospirillales bacterium]
MKARIAGVLWILCGAALAAGAQDSQETEDEALYRALAEAGSSTIDFVRGLENHLAEFPQTKRRADLERGLVKAAIELNDNRRIALYGERVLARDPGDVQLLGRVAEALLASGDKPAAGRALNYSRRLEEEYRKLDGNERFSSISAARRREQIDRGLARALVLQARAAGTLGRVTEAVELARRSYEAWPTAEGAREIGRWLSESGRLEEAIPHYADAFTLPDPRAGDAGRAADRRRMGELYRKLKGSETGLGDLILQAYDRTAALMAERRARLRELDPNAELSDPMEFTLSGLRGDKLALSSLKGKVLVLDFWATWCGPCRAQHPLYEKVKQEFRSRPDVVFLSINTDEDRSRVPEFIAANNWDDKVYFEDGLSAALGIDVIPTAVLISKRGEVESRMRFNPERFVDMLTARIRQALGE